MLESYRRNVNFIKKYAKAINASSGSEVDANANVENKNITTCMGEIPKKQIIGTNRLLMHDKLTEMYGEDIANKYIEQLEKHEIYKHDETSILPYCVSITMYPFLFGGLKDIGGISTAPTNLQAFQGSFINLVFAIASQFAGAVATPEFLTYLDYFIRKEYGNDYYLKADEIVTSGLRPKTIDKVITDGFEQVVYSMNQPAAARNFQSVFWNIAYFDHPYFDGIFGDFVFPDGTEPTWDSVNWLQKRFMQWFNKERLKTVLTFPVETLNLLNDGTKSVDEEYADFQAEMYANGHSFFTYTSNSVDSLASCCFDGNTKCLSRSSDGINYLTFKELCDSSYKETKRNFRIFHNGSWVSGKPIKIKRNNKKMYKIYTTNKKEMIVTEDHKFPTVNGDKRADEITTEDYIMFNTRPLNSFPEKDLKLTYEEGYLIGMYLGDGSCYVKENYTPTINLSINEEKYNKSYEYLKKAINKIDCDSSFKLNTPYNNVYPLICRSWSLYNFIKKYVIGNYCFEKELNLECLLQSYEFRKGILDGYYVTDGGNSNRIYTTSEKLVNQIEVLITSLGLNSVIDLSDRTNEPVIIREQHFTRNYPLYCIRWYNQSNKRNMKGIYKVINNSIYFRVSSIEEIEDYNEEYVYCFEMDNEEEPYFTLPNGVISHNCRLKNEIQDNTFSYTLGAGGVSTGSKGVLTININRLVQNTIKNINEPRHIILEKISEAVEKQVDYCHKYLLAFNSIITDYFNARLLPIYDAGYISLEKQFLTIGINGFVEGAEYLGIDISPNDEYFKYGESILKPIYDSNKKAKTKEVMFNTEFVPAENLGVKNAKWDKEDGYFVPRDCYNSYFYKVEDETCNLIDKFILHGNKLTQYLDGGSALHANLEEHLTKEQYKQLQNVAIKTGCSYYTYNIPNTICNDCGHISKHKLNKCPKCGSENIDYATRVIGYLKRVSKFSEARIKEAKERYYGTLTT